MTLTDTQKMLRYTRAVLHIIIIICIFCLDQNFDHNANCPLCWRIGLENTSKAFINNFTILEM